VIVLIVHSAIWYQTPVLDIITRSYGALKFILFIPLKFSFSFYIYDLYSKSMFLLEFYLGD